MGAARKLVTGVCGAVSVGAGLVRHVAWYLSYQVDGKAKEPGGSGKARRGG